jgi:hypothetical protein
VGKGLDIPVDVSFSATNNTELIPLSTSISNAFPGIPQSLTTFTATMFSHLSLVWDSLTNAHCLVLLLELQNLGNSESEVRFCGDAD